MSGSFSKRPSKYDRAEILLSGGVKLFTEIVENLVNGYIL